MSATTLSAVSALRTTRAGWEAEVVEVGRTVVRVVEGALVPVVVGLVAGTGTLVVEAVDTVVEIGEVLEVVLSESLVAQATAMTISRQIPITRMPFFIA
ncbi:MAG: hypothetical protein WB239_17645 [Acidimicrobiia bacterium]